MTNAGHLQEFATTRCFPYLLDLPKLQPHLDRLTFLLVGSVATGTCREDSDVDIAIVCDEEVCEAISVGTPWTKGRPSEVELQGRQLHYYAISFDTVEAGLRRLDDVFLYVYANSIILRGPEGNYSRRFGSLLASAPDVRKERVEGKLDMLIRRSGALKGCLAEGDPITTARVCLECLSLALKVTALLDDVPFDLRKRLLLTAIRGPLGRRLEARFRELFSELGVIGQLRPKARADEFAFLGKLEDIAADLRDETRRQGFQVGLDRPDRRHVEG